MMNAKRELEEAVGDRQVLYGAISVRDVGVKFGSHQEYLESLPSLDVEYDDGFGGQELYGAVAFNDGTWLERGEYDGSEWWKRKSLPSREDVEKLANREYD